MMNWVIDTKERLYQKLTDEIFFRVLHGEFSSGSKLPYGTNPKAWIPVFF